MFSLSALIAVVGTGTAAASGLNALSDGRRYVPRERDTVTDAMQALTEPYTLFSETTKTDGGVTSTITTAIQTVYAYVITSSSSETSTTSSPRSSTPTPTELSHTTAVATFTNPETSEQSLTASVVVTGTSGAAAAKPTNNHDTLLVYSTPVIAGSPATSINGATYSLAPSGAALYVDGTSEAVPWANAPASYSSGGGGGFVTAIASEIGSAAGQAAATSTTSTTTTTGPLMGSPLMVATGMRPSESSVKVASATNGVGGERRVGRRRWEVVVVVVGFVGPFVAVG